MIPIDTSAPQRRSHAARRNPDPESRRSRFDTSQKCVYCIYCIYDIYEI